jgi:hypothetical protein
VALLDGSVLDRWHLGFRRFRGESLDPALEPPSVQNCWSWALGRWMQNGFRGHLVISISPRARILRCSYAPKGDRGPLWHFEPTRPKRGIAAIWHAYLHEGRPKNMR